MPDEAEESPPGSASFAALVERHSQFVFRIALAVTRHPQDAEDVVQETFLQIYKGNRWKQIEDERAYLARVAWRLAVRQQRPRAQEQELALEINCRNASPEESAMDRQLKTWLHSRIDALPDKLRQPLGIAGLGRIEAGGDCWNSRPARGNGAAQDSHGAAKTPAGMDGSEGRTP